MPDVLTFFLAMVIGWLGLAFYLFANDPRVPSDSGGYAMGAGMFLISWGVLIAAGMGALAALAVWTAMWPRDP